MTTARDILRNIRETLSEDSPSSYMLLVQQDPLLLRLLSVWPSVYRTELPLNIDCSNVPEVAHTRWLWSIMDPDPIPGWIRQAGLPDAPHIRRAIHLAIDNHLAHPDGRLAYHVDMMLSRISRRRAQV